MSRNARLSLMLLALSLVLAGSAAPLLAADACCPSEQWKLSMQSYTFNRYTLFESIDKCKKLGIKYIELYPGQRLSPDNKSVVFNHGASDKYRKMVKDKLAEAGMKAVAYGVVGLGKDENANRKVFEFCKDMGIGVINSEPPRDALPVIDKMAGKFGIKVGIHNHPKKPRNPNYKIWDPKYVLEMVKPYKNIGSCADTGHWMRSGVRPIEAVKLLKGQIVSSHLKDLNKMGRPGEHDVPWGTGEADLRAVLEQLKKQGYKGVFSIEYEHNWTSNMPEIGKCVEWFKKTRTDIFKSK